MGSREQEDKPLPERCLRGLRSENCLERDEIGRVWVSAKAFEPHWGTRQDRRENRQKSDDYETSINWEDHVVEALRILTIDRNNAKCGIVSVRLRDLEMAKSVNPRARVALGWERAPIKGNPYHGNLLFSGMLPKTMIRELAGVVATHVQEHLILIQPASFSQELASRAELYELEMGRALDRERWAPLRRLVDRVRSLLSRLRGKLSNQQ